LAALGKDRKKDFKGGKLSWVAIEFENMSDKFGFEKQFNGLRKLWEVERRRYRLFMEAMGAGGVAFVDGMMCD
jgi:hypothetical protein